MRGLRTEVGFAREGCFPRINRLKCLTFRAGWVLTPGGVPRELPPATARNRDGRVAKVTGSRQLEPLHLANLLFQRPHRGYRTKGRVPAVIFWGVVRERRHEED